MADVFDAEVVTLQVSEGAGFGAALQALWCWRLQQGDSVAISEITDAFVKTNRSETTAPGPKSVARYRELQELQDQLGQTLRPAFARHRQYLNGNPAAGR